MKLKALVVSAVLSGSSLLAAPALACDGHKAPGAETAKPAGPGKAVVLTGTVSREGCPMESAKMDCTGCVLVLEGDKKYLIMKDETGEKLTKQIKGTQRVQVTGELFEKDGKSLVKVKKFKLITSA